MSSYINPETGKPVGRVGAKAENKPRKIIKNVIKAAPQRPDPSAKPAFFKAWSDNPPLPKSHKSKTHAPVSQQTPEATENKELPKLFSHGKVHVSATNNVREMMPEASDAEEKLAKKVNRAFEAEKNIVKPKSKQLFEGVPLSEPLDPSKIEEYCRREPYILTGFRDMDNAPKFGTIDARFAAMAQPHREMVRTIRKMRKDLKDGEIPAGYEVKALRDEKFAKLILRFVKGDDLEAELQESRERASYYMKSCAKARKIYNEQIRKDFRVLESSMDRRSIGIYAQNIWTRNKDAVHPDHPNFDPRYFNDDIRDEATAALKQILSVTPKKYMKWMALNINEIPLSRMNQPAPRLNFAKNPTFH